MSNPSLKLEVGKFYLDRRGDVVGPVQRNTDSSPRWPFRASGTGLNPLPSYYRADGTWGAVEGRRNERDLVSECDEAGNPVGIPVGTPVGEPTKAAGDREVQPEAPAELAASFSVVSSTTPAPSEYDQLVARFASRVSNQAGHQLRQESIQASTRFCDAVCRLDPRALRRIDWFKLVDVPEGTDFSVVLVDLVFEACREHHRTQALRDIASSAQISLAPDRLAE